jgi:hypothetical protein
MMRGGVYSSPHSNREEIMGILAIDPGDKQSAYVLTDKNLKPIEFDKIDNGHLLDLLNEGTFDPKCQHLAIEMIASYGMSVGKEVFDTCVWIGRFIEVADKPYTLIYRKDVKMNLCNSMKAKDSNIRQALIDRFGEVGTIKNKGFFYGFKADVWAAYAVAVTFHDVYLKGAK